MRRERERERGRTQKTQKSPTQIIVPDRVAPQNRSSSTQIVVPDRVAPQSRLSSTQIVVLDRDLAFGRSRSQHQSASRDLACCRTQSQPDYEFFFLGVICVSGLRNEIIYLFGSGENLRKCEQDVENVFSMVFSTTQPNTRKYFSQHFLKCNKTL